jgi:hypothetical protein
MAFTVSDFEDLVGLLAQHPEWRERLRPLVLGEELLAVPSRMDRVEAAIERLDAQIAALVRVTEAQGVRLDRIDGRLDRVEGHLGNLEGQVLELRYDKNLKNWLGKWFWPIDVYLDDLPQVRDAVSRGKISQSEADALRHLDLIARGKPVSLVGAPAILVAIDVSYTVNIDDVARAEQRAETLRRAGYDTRALVGGYRATDDAEQLAQRLDVILDLHRLAA